MTEMERLRNRTRHAVHPGPEELTGSVELRRDAALRVVILGRYVAPYIDAGTDGTGTVTQVREHIRAVRALAQWYEEDDSLKVEDHQVRWPEVIRDADAALATVSGSWYKAAE